MRTLNAGDLVLEPQTVAHAADMFALLSDPALYRYLDSGPPIDAGWLAARFEKLESRRSADGQQQWLNWVIRSPQAGLVGFVQATVYPDASANIAYELGSAFWGRGWASRATRAMLDELAEHDGVVRAFATVDQRNLASIKLLTRLGFEMIDSRRHPHHDVAEGDWLFLREPLRQADSASP